MAIAVSVIVLYMFPVAVARVVCHVFWHTHCSILVLLSILVVMVLLYDAMLHCTLNI